VGKRMSHRPLSNPPFPQGQSGRQMSQPFNVNDRLTVRAWDLPPR
jgi:hypothetical protein